MSGSGRVALESHAEGVVLPVKAAPGSRRDEIRGVQAGALKVAVVQVAERGRANRALGDLLARALGVRRSQLELLSGATQASKRFLVRGISREQLEQRLAALFDA